MPLVVEHGHEREVWTRLDRRTDGRYDVSVKSRSVGKSDWLQHFAASLSEAGARPKPALKLTSHRTPVPAELLSLATRGVEFGPRWMCLTSVERSATEAAASVSLKSEFAADLQSYGTHPATLDVAATIGLFALRDYDKGGKLFVPLSIGSFRQYAPLPRSYQAAAKLKGDPGASQAVFDVEITGPDGQPLVDIRDLTMRSIEGGDFQVARDGPSLETSTSILDRLVAAGIRREEAPRLFTAAFASSDRKVIITPTPLTTLRAAFQPKPALQRKAKPKVAAAGGVGAGDDIEARISEMCADILGLDTVDPDTDLLSYGGGSLMGVRLFVRIRKELGAELALSALFQAPTIRALATHVRSLVTPEPAQEATAQAADGGGTHDAKPRVAAAPWSPLVRIKAGPGSKRPLYCIHGAGGNVVVFKPIADRLTSGRGMYGLQARGTDGKLPPHESIAEMASCYVEAIREVDPSGPYFLAGYSGGGVIAYEMAQQITASGGDVDKIIMFDTVEPTEMLRPVTLAERLRLIPKVHPEVLLSWPRNLLSDIASARFARNVEAGIVPEDASPLQVAGTLATEAYKRAQHNYKPRPYAGDILLFRANRARIYYVRSGDMLGWEKFVNGNIHIRTIDADHYSVFESPAIDDLMVVLNRELDALDVEPAHVFALKAAS